MYSVTRYEGVRPSQIPYIISYSVTLYERVRPSQIPYIIWGTAQPALRVIDKHMYVCTRSTCRWGTSEPSCFVKLYRQCADCFDGYTPKDMNTFLTDGYTQ